VTKKLAVWPAGLAPRLAIMTKQRRRRTSLWRAVAAGGGNQLYVRRWYREERHLAAISLAEIWRRCSWPEETTVSYLWLIMANGLVREESAVWAAGLVGWPILAWPQCLWPAEHVVSAWQRNAGGGEIIRRRSWHHRRSWLASSSALSINRRRPQRSEARRESIIIAESWHQLALSRRKKA